MFKFLNKIIESLYVRDNLLLFYFLLYILESKEFIILIYIFLHRALELAVRHKRKLEEILEARAKYLQTIDKKETNQSFLTHIAKSQPVNEVSYSL